MANLEEPQEGDLIVLQVVWPFTCIPFTSEYLSHGWGVKMIVNVKLVLGEIKEHCVGGTTWIEVGLKSICTVVFFVCL